MKRRINIKTLAVLIIAAISAYVILHDVYMLSIHSWITKTTYSWTWLGFFTWIISVVALDFCYEYINDFND